MNAAQLRAPLRELVASWRASNDREAAAKVLEIERFDSECGIFSVSEPAFFVGYALGLQLSSTAVRDE